MRIVLASGSPRRRELLASLGIRPDVEVPDVDESRHADEPPTGYVARLALAKAAAVADRSDLADAFVLAADTTVELDGEVLGKPTDPADARAALARLSGRRHLVHTGVAARRGARREHVVVTTVVTFRELTDGDLDRYVATGEPMDKAGSYAIQGAGGAFVRRIDGSVSNVIGLPLAEVVDLGRRLDVDLTDERVTGTPGRRGSRGSRVSGA